MTSKKASISKQFAMFGTILFAVLFAVIFIEEYCRIFEELGLFAKERLVANPAFTFIASPILFWISAYLCRKFAINASGNSIDHIKESLLVSHQHPQDFEKLSPRLGMKVIIVKTLSSLLCVFGGGALGREGPSAHMSAGIFAVIASKSRKYLPKLDFETWILAGSATGMAIAFCAPISGFVFVSEKILKSRSNSFSHNVFWVFVTIVIVAIVLMHYDPIFIVADLRFDLASQFSSIILTALICGVLAFLFKKTNIYFYKKLVAIQSYYWHLVPICAGLSVAAIGYYCGVYSFSGGIYTADEALLSSQTILSYKEVIGRVANTIISFISGCAGGLVAPAIAIGAGIGSIISSLTPYIDSNIFLLIGMAAFLGAAIGEPLTAAMIIFEITGQSIANLPFLLCGALLSFYCFKTSERIWMKAF